MTTMFDRLPVRVLGGMPPFLGFAPVAWASLVGHVGLGLGIAGALAFMTRGET
ncbi:MAG: hypothetical protein IT556_09245 [Acetobacteraceae bacterium]|nr:hypothetical protein [Acetobacteraceae bacterium]